METRTNETRKSFCRKAFSRNAFLALSGAALAACVPVQDPNDPDQAPDINYTVTELKDTSLVGSLPHIDQEVLDRMIGKFPGCAIGIVDGGEVVYLKGYGVADFHIKGNPFDDDLFTKDTVVGIGSVSKTLTAMAIMALKDMGKVQLNASLASYFPHAVPAGWHLISVRDVMAHRGGFERDPNPAAPGALSAADVDAIFGEQHSSQHPRRAIREFLATSLGNPTPAKIGDYHYSNIGYTVLGALIDNVTNDGSFPDTQTGYERFVWSLVTGASDSSLTAALDQHWRDGDIPNLAQSYDGNWDPMDTPYSGWQGPAGGWSMTIGDLSRVLANMMTNEIVTGANLAQMRTNPGFGGSYGLGLFLDPKLGQPAYHHGGSIDGFRTQVLVLPESDIAVAVFANADRSGVGAIADAVALSYLENRDVAPEFSRFDMAVLESDRGQASLLIGLLLPAVQGYTESGGRTVDPRFVESVGRMSPEAARLVEIGRSPRKSKQTDDEAAELLARLRRKFFSTPDPREPGGRKEPVDPENN